MTTVIPPKVAAQRTYSYLISFASLKISISRRVVVG